MEFAIVAESNRVLVELHEIEGDGGTSDCQGIMRCEFILEGSAVNKEMPLSGERFV